MPLELGVWRIDSGCHRVDVSSLVDESRLEDLLDGDISIASPNWMIIGRQVRTDYGNFIDLLAIDRDGKIIVIELKRDKTPRDVVAQVLDYASWVKKLDDDDIGKIFGDYLKKYHPNKAKQSIDEEFCSRFKVSEMPENLNEEHELVVVASTLDESTERIVKYLSDDHGVGINVIFFRIFKDGDREFLTRAWLIDPTEVASIPAVHSHEEWNGEFYVSFGEGDRRNWEDARKYGFISAGGGNWYSKTLSTLEPGNRVWANVPGTGYVGVGIVKASVVKVDRFMVKQPDGRMVPITEVEVHAPQMFTDKDDTENAEYLVAVDWTDTRPMKKAIHEKGFFGNQNTVCQPTTKKWNYTVERLKQQFKV